VHATRRSRWQKGQPAVPGDIGFCEFYQANYAGLVTLVTALLGDRNEAQDVAQEAFARAYIRWPAVGRYEVPQAWVRKVAVRIAIDSTRRIRRVGRLSERLITQQRAAAQTHAEGISTSLGDALLRLPVREREMLVLHYLADMPVETIARERGMAAGTVKARLSAGRRHLEQELERQAKAVPDAG
jgi:RNA polymerase sigma-70 factor, ECF subfamily